MLIWRLIKSEAHNAFTNMAIDEAILRARIEEKVPNTVRIYSWRPSAVSIGRFQKIRNEVQLENCRKHGVSVVRRISGGGAVYHDSQDEVTYSIVVKQKDLGTDDIAETYKFICSGVIEAAHVLGVGAEYRDGNIKQCPNITVTNRKISGSAQAIKKGTILQHGTFLLNVDSKKMFTFLKAPRKNAIVNIDASAKKSITSVAEELGEQIQPSQAFEALMEGFEKGLEIKLLEENLTECEVVLAKKLERMKFATREWNFNGMISRSEPVC